MNAAKNLLFSDTLVELSNILFGIAIFHNILNPQRDGYVDDINKVWNDINDMLNSILRIKLCTGSIPMNLKDLIRDSEMLFYASQYWLDWDRKQ